LYRIGAAVQFHVAHNDAEIRGLVGVDPTDRPDYRLRLYRNASVKVLSGIMATRHITRTRLLLLRWEAVMDNLEAVLH
jgi:hypothetical protein